jgi:hypothetical protein
MSTIAIEDEAADTGLFAELGSTHAELAMREQNGVAVSLHWVRGTNVVFVSVVDRRNGEAFELVLEPDERALDVFHHPYAYAATRGLDVGRPRFECEEEEELVDV